MRASATREDDNVKPRRLLRDVTIGVALGTCFGIAISFWVAHNRDDNPSFDALPTATAQPLSSTAPGGRGVTGGTASNPGIAVPVSPSTSGERQLARVWEPVTQLQTQGESYSAVTLEALGKQLPDTAFLPGNRASQNPREISVSSTRPSAIALAVVEAQQCIWLREQGHGPEVTRATLDTHHCRADAPPADAVWNSFVPA